MSKLRESDENRMNLPALTAKHYCSVIAPVELFTFIGTLVSGVFVGPWTTAAAFAGSNSAPWHGHNRCWLPGSYCTGHPACVQVASNATNFPFVSRTRTPGSPLEGIVNVTELLGWTELTFAISVEPPVVVAVLPEAGVDWLLDTLVGFSAIVVVESSLPNE